MRKVFLPASILLGTCVLAIFIFWSAISKPVPPGVDAGVYLNDAHWILEHQTVPKLDQATYHGSHAYPAPLSAVNLAIAKFISGLDLTFPIFSAYQILLIVLLILTSYLVGSIYGPRISWLYPISLLGSFAIIRLFVGSTISNLLAFSYMNIAYYLVYQFRQRLQLSILVVLGLFLAGVYFTHNYLTAPIFLPTFIMYGAYMLLVDREFRSGCFNRLRALNRKFLIAFLAAIGGALMYLVIAYIPVYQEAKNAFWQTIAVSKFQIPVPFFQYGDYLGPILFAVGIAGLFLYIVRFRENILSYRIFPVLWVAVLLVLLQLYRFGINFFYERLLFLGGPTIALFAAYAVNAFIELRPKKNTFASFSLCIYVLLVISSGLNNVKTLYESSNRVTINQIEALRILKRVALPNELTLSHVNAVSQTNHDVVVSDRDIAYLPTDLEKCDTTDLQCRAFNSPTLISSRERLQALGAHFFLFIKPSFDGNQTLDRLIMKYRQAGFPLLYESADALLFQLPTS